MGHDEEWRRKLQARTDRLRQQIAAEERATRENEEAREAASESSPRRDGRIKTMVWFLVLTLAIVLLAEVAMTIARFTGPDFGDAKRTGQATVRSCERHGPIGEGFGYWDSCTADVVWADGTRERIRPGKQGFFSAEEIGKTVTVGDLGRGRGGQVYARPELPSRPWVTAVAAIPGMAAVLIGMGLLWILWRELRELARKVRGAGTGTD